MITTARFIMIIVMMLGSGTLLGFPLYCLYAALQPQVIPFSIAELCGFIALSGLALAGIAVFTASPVGDNVKKLFLPVRKQSLREEAQLRPVLERIQALYRDKHGQDIKARVLIFDMPHINGLALGRKTIAVSTGLLKVGSDEEIAAVLSHEIGHLHHGDGFFNIVMVIVGYPVMLLGSLLDKILAQGAKLKAFNAKTGGSDADTIFREGIGIALSLAYFACLAVFFVLAVVVVLIRRLDRTTAWPIEYRADRFAFNMGYGEGLVELLERIEDEDVRGATGFLKKYMYSHPPTALRIDRLERMLGVKMKTI